MIGQKKYSEADSALTYLIDYLKKTLEDDDKTGRGALSAAYGNRGEGAHGSFGRFPANFATPMHVHTGAYHGIVIRGEMTNPFKGETTPPTMGPGSYWHVPAGAEHATACVSAEPCEFYFHADSAFDFTPVE